MEGSEAVRLITTREAVEALREQGLSATRLAAELGIGKSTVCYHLRRLGEPADSRCNRRYDWERVQRYYDEGHGVTQCLDHFGMTRASFVAAVRRGAVRTRPQRKPIEELLRPGVNRNNLRLRLLADGIKEARCERCGLTEWLGRPAPLQLHHVNGDGQDNRFENLQILCPNCHSLTDSWGGRNRGKIGATTR
ncbi:MAG TPA: HNH endonuclease [Solirubrobacteraceae bacterium]|nr:HNH endonuclease [Solirubrobacteraceae bacterium]